MVDYTVDCLTKATVLYCTVYYWYLIGRSLSFWSVSRSITHGLWMTKGQIYWISFEIKCLNGVTVSLILSNQLFCRLLRGSAFSLFWSSGSVGVVDVLRVEDHIWHSDVAYTHTCGFSSTVRGGPSLRGTRTYLGIYLRITTDNFFNFFYLTWQIRLKWSWSVFGLTQVLHIVHV